MNGDYCIKNINQCTGAKLHIQAIGNNPVHNNITKEEHIKKPNVTENSNRTDCLRLLSPQFKSSLGLYLPNVTVRLFFKGL